MNIESDGKLLERIKADDQKALKWLVKRTSVRFQAPFPGRLAESRQACRDW